jgi:hypothetical protein
MHEGTNFRKSKAGRIYELPAKPPASSKIIGLRRDATAKKPGTETKIRFRESGVRVQVPAGRRYATCWSKIKQFLRTAKARSVEALELSVAEALATVTPENIQDCLKHCGYGT